MRPDTAGCLPARRRGPAAGGTVPPALREYAGLTKDCVVIGANTRVEVWDSAAWEAYLADREQAFAELEEEVLPGVL